MLDFSLSKEQIELIENVRRFAIEFISPEVKRAERAGEYPVKIIRAMGEKRLTGLFIPRDYEGLGLDYITSGLLIEEMAKAGDPNLPVNIGASYMLLKYGNEELRRKWLPKIARGECLFGVASTEPHAGSDAANIKTTAVKKEGYYIINGEKKYIDLANVADCFIVTARTGSSARDITCFVLEGKFDGVERYGIEHMGPGTLDFGGLRMNQVRIPDSNIIGEENQGFKYLTDTFDFMRIIVCLKCIGLASSSLDESIEYAKRREAFGKPIAKFQAVQFRIIQDITELEAARLLCYKTLWMLDRGMKITKEAAMLKSWIPELCFRIVNNSIQNMGAFGYTREAWMDARLKAVRGYMIGDGTGDIAKAIAGREILGREYVTYK